MYLLVALFRTRIATTVHGARGHSQYVAHGRHWFGGVLFSFVVSFFPPDPLPVGSPGLYTGLVAVGIIVFAGIPLTIHHVRTSDWATVHGAPVVRPAAIPLE